jgi:hypothetical protein
MQAFGGEASDAPGEEVGIYVCTWNGNIEDDGMGEDIHKWNGRGNVKGSGRGRENAALSRAHGSVEFNGSLSAKILLREKINS